MRLRDYPIIMIRFLLGTPYMITCNIDVTDGLVNGAFGILRHIEYGEEEEDNIKRVWLHIEKSKIGKLLKSKSHAHVASKQELNHDWVPIGKRTTNISFKTRSLSCKRLQFSLVEACALTIYKSQGGTYDTVVYEYDKEDLITDFVLPTTKIMVLNETWLNNDDEVKLRGYRCVTQFKREKVRSGRVAMYEKNDCKLFSTPHILMKFYTNLLQIHRCMAVSEKCGDICTIESTINGRRALMVTVYVSPNAKMEDIQCFFLTNLLMFTPKASEMFELLREKGFGQIPIILSGDINMDLKKKENEQFVNFMEETFGLTLKTNPGLATTRGGSCIDMVFTRHLDKIDCKNYVSYFSYH